jgi:hypothetical protein
MAKRAEKQYKRSQLRNIVECELSHKLTTKARTSMADRWSEEKDDIIEVWACNNCTRDDWRDE